MIAYQTDETGRYVGAVECQPNPLKEGEWLLPAGACFTPPPSPHLPSYYKYDTERGAWYDNVFTQEEKARLLNEPVPIQKSSLSIVKTIVEGYLSDDDIVALGKYCFDLLREKI